MARAVGGDSAELAQAISLSVTSGADGADARIIAVAGVAVGDDLQKHFFEHRYDYPLPVDALHRDAGAGAKGDGAG